VLRDGDRAEYSGLSVHRAAPPWPTKSPPFLSAPSSTTRGHLDRVMIELDGTPDKHRSAETPIYSTSVALLRRASAARGACPLTLRRRTGWDSKPPTTVPAPAST